MKYNFQILSILLTICFSSVTCGKQTRNNTGEIILVQLLNEYFRTKNTQSICSQDYIPIATDEVPEPSKNQKIPCNAVEGFFAIAVKENPQYFFPDYAKKGISNRPAEIKAIATWKIADMNLGKEITIQSYSSAGSCYSGGKLDWLRSDGSVITSLSFKCQSLASIDTTIPDLAFKARLYASDWAINLILRKR